MPRIDIRLDPDLIGSQVVHPKDNVKSRWNFSLLRVAPCVVHEPVLFPAKEEWCVARACGRFDLKMEVDGRRYRVLEEARILIRCRTIDKELDEPMTVAIIHNIGQLSVSPSFQTMVVRMHMDMMPNAALPIFKREIRHPECLQSLKDLDVSC